MKEVAKKKTKRKSRESGGEQLRRTRLGELRRLFRDRYGSAVLPDDDAGREDLRELLLLASLAFNPERTMLDVMSQAAPWMWEGGELTEEWAQMIDDVNRTPLYLRKPSARDLGDRQRLTDEERERLAIRTMRPHDVTDEKLIERRKTKDAARKWRERRAAKIKPRDAWLANCLSRTKPWEKLRPPVSRRTWERRRNAMSHVPVASVSRSKDY
jgi:hypothetical protein